MPAAFPRAADVRDVQVRDVRQIRDVRRINTDTDGRRRNNQRGGVTGAGLAELDEAGAGVSATEQCDAATVEKDPHGCRAGDGLTVGQRVTEGSVEGNDAVDAEYLYRPTGARGISDDAESGRWCDLVVRGDQ